MTVETPSQLPLSGITVLDLSMMTAGPVGTMLLGDLGADVIKIEEPHAGDLARNLGTEFAGGESVQFLSQNRNKRSVRLDLKQPAGREVFLELASRCDVVVENFRPGTVERLGIGYEAVKAVNPQVIYASVSAYGQSGPYAGWPGNDPIVQAITGLMAMTGEPGGEPVRLGAPLPDFGGAAMLAFGVCAALLHRQRHGVGQRIETSLLAASLFSTIPRDGETIRSGRSPQRLGSGHPTMVPYRNYRGSDGQFFFIAAFTAKFWNNLCQGIGKPELARDPRFASNPARTAHRAELDAILEDVFASRPAAEWVALLSANDIPSALVQDYHAALTSDPQIRHTGALIEFEHPRAGTTTNIANPVTFHASPARVFRPPPVLGEHSAEVLAEHGFTPERIRSLLDAGVVQEAEAVSVEPQRGVA